MTNRRRFAYVAGGVVLLVAAFVAWQISGRERPSRPTTLRVGIIPITDCTQLYVAKHAGIFARHGIDAQLVPMAGGAVILQGLSAGAVDVAFSNLASVVFYERNAGPLRRLAGGTMMDSAFSEAGLVVRKGSGINTLADLRGKTIAVNTLRNIVDLAVVRALRKHGVEASEVKLVELPFKDMDAALRAGQIDAATLPEPILSRAMAAGGLRNLGDHFVLAFGQIYSTGYFALPNREPAAPELLERFNSAIQEATPIANAYAAEAVRAISIETKIAESDLTRAGHPRFVEELPDSALEQMRAWLMEERFLDR